jgi:hypothetical protein
MMKTHGGWVAFVCFVIGVIAIFIGLLSVETEGKERMPCEAQDATR